MNRSSTSLQVACSYIWGVRKLLGVLGMINWVLERIHKPKSGRTSIDTPRGGTLGLPWRQVLFLDFDGVMHRAENGSFENMPQLKWLLESLPDLRLVISSDWRLTMDEAALLALFPKEIRSRIVGTTPYLRGQPREQECRQFALEHGVVRYLAVDDDTTVFSSGCPFLVQTDRYIGLDSAVAERIVEQFATGWWTRKSYHG